MKNKCKLEDGKCYPCDGFDPSADDSIDYFYPCCRCCGDVIEKPEQEVIIKQSGGTYAVFYDWINYLCVDPKSMVNIPDKECIEAMIRQGILKEITEIEITDEIAKLRPFIINDNGYSTILFGVLDGGEIITSVVLLSQIISD